MPTVIDELVVILGLDPKNFTKGQKEALAALKQTREKAEVETKGIEHAGGRVANAFGVLRGGFAGLIGGAFGALSIAAIGKVIGSVTNAGIETGRTARIIGASADQLKVWQHVAEKTGGSAKGITTAMEGLSGELQNVKLGLGSEKIAELVRTGEQVGVTFGDLIDKDYNIKDIDAFILRLSTMFTKIKELSGAPTAFQVGKVLGFDAPTIDLWIRGVDNLRQLHDEAKKTVGQSAEQTKANEELRKSYVDLTGAVEHHVQTMVTAASPALKRVMDMAVLSDRAASGKTPEIREEAKKKLRELQKQNRQELWDWYKTKDSGFGDWVKGMLPKLPPPEAFMTGDLFGGGKPKTKQDRIGPDYTGSDLVAPRTKAERDQEKVEWLKKNTLLGRWLLSPKLAAGGSTETTDSLEQMLAAEISGLKQVTGRKDRGYGSHAAGRALDFTIQDPNQAQATVKRIQDLLNAKGVSATVLNEYGKEYGGTPSPNATGPHIHVQLNSADDAKRFSQTQAAVTAAMAGTPAPGRFPVTAGMMSSAAAATRDGGSSTTRNETVNVNTLNVVTQATDATGIARSIRGALSTRSAIDRAALAQQANSGPGG